MDKSIPTSMNQKRSSAPKQTKHKAKQQPLKVVYITNPIKFKATVSEFRALVQELTGQDADMSDNSTWFSTGYDGVSTGESETKLMEGVNVLAPEEGHRVSMEAGENESDPPSLRSSYHDVLDMPGMMDGFGPGLMDCHEGSSYGDVYKSLDEL